MKPILAFKRDKLNRTPVQQAPTGQFHDGGAATVRLNDGRRCEAIRPESPEISANLLDHVFDVLVALRRFHATQLPCPRLPMAVFEPDVTCNQQGGTTVRALKRINTVRGEALIGDAAILELSFWTM